MPITKKRAAKKKAKKAKKKRAKKVKKRSTKKRAKAKKILDHVIAWVEEDGRLEGRRGNKTLTFGMTFNRDTGQIGKVYNRILDDVETLIGR